MNYRSLMAITLFALGAGCVSKAQCRTDVLAAYKKGLKVGRVIGRDEILGELKSPDCFTQSVNELMNQDKHPAAIADTTGGKLK